MLVVFFIEAETSNPMRKSAIGVSLAKSLHEVNFFPGLVGFFRELIFGPYKWPEIHG